MRPHCGSRRERGSQALRIEQKTRVSATRMRPAEGLAPFLPRLTTSRAQENQRCGSANRPPRTAYDFLNRHTAAIAWDSGIEFPAFSP
jgi:hypothetical protein